MGGLPAGDSGQGPGGRLVWSGVDPLGGVFPGRLVYVVCGAFMAEQDAAGESEDAEELEFRPGVCADRHVRALHLLDDYDPAAVLPGAFGVYRVCGGPGGGAAWDWVDSWHAGDRV